ncbi:MAG: hypothetical protein KIT80_11175 [Chitinophagaceae bacterium]|nr:hypothetical protein [Chitinophagaceae bacterium]MCW5927464.1 hypothetical protein [Chitinophagaceae bacterium]
MKIYTLLRDNQESGSFTYEELVSKKLRKLDLIWVEGESIVWKYPSEIKELKKYVQEVALTDATVVNSRKEKQIRHFHWKKELATEQQPVTEEMLLNEQVSDYLPDAYLSDVPAGYEFLLELAPADYDALPQETVEEEIPVKNEPGYDYKVLGTSQVIDTREEVANPAFFRSTIELPVRYKSSKMEKETPSDEHRVKKKNRQRRKRATKLPMLLMVIASAFMHLKL